MGQSIICDHIPPVLLHLLNQCLEKNMASCYLLSDKSIDNEMLQNCVVFLRSGEVLSSFSDEELLRIRKQLDKTKGFHQTKIPKGKEEGKYNYQSEGRFFVELYDGVYAIRIIRSEKHGHSSKTFVPKLDDKVWIGLEINEKMQSSSNSNFDSNLEQLFQLSEHQDFKSLIEIIPQTLQKSISLLSDFQNKIEEAEFKLYEIENEADGAVKTAQTALRSSLDAWEESNGAEAIKKIQSAGTQMGSALLHSTDIHLKIIESQAALLDVQAQQLKYQKILMELSKGLLLLGAYNQQTNKALYQELIKQLSTASAKNIGELGMRELQSVASQLKEQQDILTRIETLENKFIILADEIEKMKKEN